MKYVVIIEEGPTSVGAYVPDLPGCVAVAETRPEVERMIGATIAFHIEGLREAGEAVPAPASSAIAVDVPAA